MYIDYTFFLGELLFSLNLITDLSSNFFLFAVSWLSVYPDILSFVPWIPCLLKFHFILAGQGDYQLRQEGCGVNF